MSFHVALEITPPRTPNDEILLRRARLLGARAHAIHLIQRPDRVSSLDAALRLRRENLDAVWHLALRGRSRDEIRQEIERALAGGVRSVLCLRGEHRASDKPDTPKIREAVALLRAADAALRIGVTLNQYLDPRRTLPNLRAKLDAGADFVQTQPVISLAALLGVAASVRETHPDARLLGMLMPFETPDDAARIRARLGVPLPAQLLAELRTGPDAGWAVFERTLQGLRDSDLVSGVALMTLRADPPPETTRRIAALLDTSEPNL